MKYEMTLTIRNLHAEIGDHVVKPHVITKQIFQELDETETEREINEEPAESIQRASTRTKKREKVEPLISFKPDFTYRLGGPYGKVMGLFKETGGILYKRKTSGFKSSYKPLIKSLLLKPQYVKLVDRDPVEINEIPQITAGRSKALILQYYEQLPECKAEMNLEFDDKDKPLVDKLLETSIGVPFGPKRRAEITNIQTKPI